MSTDNKRGRDKRQGSRTFPASLRDGASRKRFPPRFSSRAVEPTCVFGPLQDGRDLVALLRLADPVAGRRADADGVQVGLHAAQKRRGGGGAVWDLEVHAVGLQDTNRSDGGSRWMASMYRHIKPELAKLMGLNAADGQFLQHQRR